MELLALHTGVWHDEEEGLQDDLPSDRVPGRASDPSRSRDGDDGGYRLFRGFLIGYLGFSSRGHLIGGRGGRGGARAGLTTPWREPGWAVRPGGVVAPWPLSVSYSGI